ncbi:hypothetical protein BJY52DRAFT_1402243 [Lactarius psammicola]|nr:hypothetical protein BJY52DRAFT_1402243 [Lactarius psammicola]
MTPRSSFASKRRPLSAIFLGAGSAPSPSDLPDLPEPPSPGASSTNSGLPSPPATNSTGSGSAGDSREILDRPSDPLTSSALAMRNEKPLNSRSSRASSPAGGSESRKGEDDEEEDNTARLNLSRRRGASQSSDHVMTLQRVMSLTQRNRMALNKLSSMRLNTPSPPQPSHSSRSPNPPSALAPSASASTSTRSRSVEPAALSGSETEREPGAHHSNSSDDQSVTPPSSVSHAYSALDGRLRRISLPASPSKGKVALSTRSFSPGPSQRTPKKRVSIMSMPDPEVHEHDPNDVTSAALAAVASLRRSPGSSGKKNRQPLPREFLEPRRPSSDGRTSKEPTTPQKLPRERYSSLASDTSPSRTSVRRTLQNPNSSQRSSQVNQVPTMRKHQTRWMSEDLRTTSARSIVDDNEDDDPGSSNNGAGIRQTVRGGSMETSLGTRLVGGSLRAAGMGVKTGTDVFCEPEESSTIAHRPTSIRTGPIQEQESVASSSRESGPSRAAILHDHRTPANAPSQYLLERGAHSGPRSRPSTSMADFLPFNEDLPPPKTAPPGLRTYKSAYALDRDREGIGSRQGSSTPFSAMPQERSYGSPRTRPREFPLDEQAVEHLRLMDLSLTRFEALLSRLPPMGDTTTATVPEVFRNAQAVVRFSEQVNGMLRAATNRALERLVDSEVSDASAAGEVDMVGLWKDIGGDFRDMLRVSDELVRTTTGFLLGVGKVLHESATVGASIGAGSSLQHLRGASEDLSRRSGTDGRSSTSAGTGTGSGRGSGSGDGLGGRRSTESRRSWDPARVERDKGDLLRRASSRVDVGALSGQRASSSMLLREREPPTRERTVDPEDAPARLATSSTRRLYTPGYQREGTPASAKPELVTIESQRSLHIEDDYEPSPTPAPRPRQSLDESVRKLPQLTIPAPLPTLPSESRAAAEQQAQTDKSTSTSRRKISAASTVTMRGNTGNPGLTITTPSAAPTTAVTTLPVSRTDSGQSSASASSSAGAGAGAGGNTSRHAHSNTVTFSRPLTVSVSALSGLQRHRPSSSEAPPLSAGLTPVTPLSAGASSPWTPRSGSETERPPMQTRFTLGLGRRTLGSKSQLSLDAPPQPAQTSTAAKASARGGGGGVQTLARASTRERRRTITEIFS